jgi:signal transduction histidine kinase
MMVGVHYLFKKLRELRRSSLQVRFLQRVLLPPFLILAVISIAGFIFLSSVVLNTAVNDLNRVAVSTSAKLEREFALRKSVLLSTGNEMFKIRSEYRDKQKSLQTNYEACRNFVKSNSKFTAAPGGVCESFYAQFAIASQSNTSLTKAADDGLKAGSSELTALELSSVNDRLDAFKEFFPETTRMLVIDKSGEVMNKTGSIKEDDAKYLGISKRALKSPVEALYMQDEKVRQLVFAYPIKEGAVLAAYNLDHEGFLFPSWKGAPVSSDQGYVMVADTKSQVGYPNIDDEGLYKPVLEANIDGRHTDFASAGIDYMATSEPVAGTSWKVISASPKAIALGTLAYAQILAVAVAGVLLVSFVWVGSRFVRKTVDSILGLVGGAVIFSSGQLTYRIDESRMSDKEFAQLADTMNKMAAKIQDAEAAIDQKNKEFISVATHEIKAPMTVVIGSLSMILDDGMGKVDETARQLAIQAYKGTVRLRELVNELLDIARLESGRAKFDLVRLNVGGEINEMIEVQKLFAAEKGIVVNYQSHEQPIFVVADKTKLEIILTNFISNGIKYNRPNGSVTIAHEIQGNAVQITITDTGLGIPEEQQASMFQKFFRVEGSDRSSIPGTGLGMYITKQFIEGMGGKLWFESVHGQGTSFHFTVPLATDDKQITPITEIEKRV